MTDPEALLSVLMDDSQPFALSASGCASLPRSWGGRSFRRPEAALHDHMLWGISQGRLRVHGDTGERPLPQGCAMWIHGGDRSHFSLHPECEQATVYFCRFRLGVEPLPQLEQTLHIAEGLAGEMAAIVHLQREAHRDGLHRIRLRAQLAAFLAHMLEHRDELVGGLRHHQRERCLGFIHEHLARGLRLDELAAHCGLNAAYLSRAFRRSMGCSIRAYCKAARVREAQALLRETPQNLDAIAEQLGYSDQFHFSRQFKEVVGVSPSQWREG